MNPELGEPEFGQQHTAKDTSGIESQDGLNENLSPPGS